jgi:hypothetical protein
LILSEYLSNAGSSKLIFVVTFELSQTALTAATILLK